MVYILIGYHLFYHIDQSTHTFKVNLYSNLSNLYWISMIKKFVVTLGLSLFQNNVVAYLFGNINQSVFENMMLQSSEFYWNANMLHANRKMHY